MTKTKTTLVFATAFLWAGSALALDAIVEKKAFELPSYTTVGGKTIAKVRIGYETYGALNAAKDNAILIPHFFSGTSHVAGKYKESDPQPGYWDAIVGPGRPLDTDRFHIIGVDALVNLNAKDPNVITTGPASLNPATGKPYGLSFPLVSVRDWVNVQKALIESLGIKRLHAVMGGSGGAVQTVDWAAGHPDMVARMIPVIGPGLGVPAYGVAMLDMWGMPIRLDPKWNGGDYYGKEEPIEGLARGLGMVTWSAVDFTWAEKGFGLKWAKADANPMAAYGNQFAVEAALYGAGKGRAAVTDANHMLYTIKAYQAWSVENEVKAIKAKSLFIAAKTDLIFPPVLSHKAAEALKANGLEAQVIEIESDGLGHLAGVSRIGQAGEAIKAFLAK
ncbi:MAG: homoserine O-acetyltransferase [Alphaproteobacteria bacterium]|nr:homoserine O-acetyltransferase [Alphaproteobacteria bacterium]